MTFVAPLDLEYWLVTTFAGDVTIFIFIAFLFIAAAAAYFRMPNIILVGSFVLFAVIGVSINSTIAGPMLGIFLLIILLAALSVFYLISRLFKN